MLAKHKNTHDTNNISSTQSIARLYLEAVLRKDKASLATFGISDLSPITVEMQNMIAIKLLAADNAVISNTSRKLQVDDTTAKKTPTPSAPAPGSFQLVAKINP